MRRLIFSCLIGFSILIASGCATKPAPVTIGLIPSGERSADLRDDRIRLLGEDKAPAVPLDEPVYQIPFTAIGAGFDAVFVAPSVRLYMLATGDTAATAARKILDQQSPDNRRFGALRLSDEAYARKGQPERAIWADLATHDKDYTVRAAGIRALNRSRDPEHTQIFVDALNDAQPLVRLEAVKALANVPNNRAAGPLTDLLARDVSRDVRIAAADALRAYKTQETAHALISTLPGTDFDVAWQSRQSLRLMTAHDFGYDEQAWLGYLTETRQPFAD